MDDIVHLLYQITSNGVWVIIIAVFLFLLSVTKRKLIVLGILILVLAVLNFIFGHELTNSLVYKYGKDGTALISNIEKTNDVYNYRPVMEYRIIISVAGDEKVNTTFRSDDFNVYPMPKTGYSYPRQGIPFSVKYMEKHPEVFIIVPQ